MDEKEMIFGTYNHWKVSEDTWFITTLNGSLYLYLLEGEEYALLIDTAYGFGRLREYVEKLTDKPLIVVNTHGHLDHVGGNGWWEEVYIHKNGEIDMETLKDSEFDVNTLPYPQYKKHFIEEGYKFNLGGREVEAIDISAHSNSSLAFLDKKSRMIFVGDELEAQQVLMFDGIGGDDAALKYRIKKHLSNMEKLKSRESDFDFLCPSHNGSPIAKSYIDDFIALDKLIVEDKHYIEPDLNHFYLGQTPFASKLRRTRYNKASFIYMVSE